MLRRALALLAFLCAGQFPAQGHAAAAGCDVLHVHAPPGETVSTVASVRLPGGSPRTLGALPYRVDAIGYSDAQQLGYGVGRRGAGPARAVTVDRYGRARDLGRIGPSGAAPIPAATAGAVSGTTWYLGAAGSLYTVDINPGSRSYLRVQRVRELRPKRLAAVDDFAVDPASGRLYGVALSTRGDVIAVSVDPASGRVRPEPRVQLPSTASVGSVVLAADRTLFASVQRAGGPGQWYRVQRTGGVSVAGTVPAAAGTDAAGCLPPVPRFGPRPPGRMLPPVPREPSPPAAPPSRDAPTRPGGSQPDAIAQQEREQEVTEKQDATEKKRRWSLAMLIMILGAGATLHRTHR